LFAGVEGESWAASERLNQPSVMLVKQWWQSLTSKRLLKGIKLSLLIAECHTLMALLYSAFGVRVLYCIIYILPYKTLYTENRKTYSQDNLYKQCSDQQTQLIKYNS
jgi:hypothetical protein